MKNTFTTVAPLVLGLSALALGAVEDLGLLNQGVNLFGLALVSVALLKEGISLRRDLRPVRTRRALSVSVLASAEQAEAAADFVHRLHDLGFRRAGLARDPSECHGQAVVLFRPAPEVAPALVERLQVLAPDAHVLVFSHTMIRELRLSETLTAANSMMRLLGDLVTVAELKAAGL